MNATRNTRHTTAETSGNDIEANATRISSHAKLRVMQRLGVIEQAGVHVRELLADAVPVEEDDRYPNCRAYRRGNVTIVLDSTDDVVKTVVTEVSE